MTHLGSSSIIGDTESGGRSARGACERGSVMQRVGGAQIRRKRRLLPRIGLADQLPAASMHQIYLTLLSNVPQHRHERQVHPLYYPKSSNYTTPHVEG